MNNLDNLIFLNKNISQTGHGFSPMKFLLEDVQYTHPHHSFLFPVPLHYFPVQEKVINIVLTIYSFVFL